MPFKVQTPALARLLAALLTIVFLAQIVFSVNREVMTNDEGYHTYAGLRYWQCADFGVNPEHPPMAKIVAAFPLRLTHIPLPDGPCPVPSTSKGDGYGDSDKWLYTPDASSTRTLVDRVIPLARRAMLLWPLLLAVTAFLFTRAIFGTASALAALTLVAFEPTLIAHGALVTTDMALSAASLLAVATLYTWHAKPTPWRILFAGLACGLCLSVKHSGVLTLLALGILTVFAIQSRWDTASRGRLLLRYITSLAAVCGIGFCVLWATYHFRFAARPNGVPLTLPLSDFISHTQAQGNRSIMLSVIPVCARFHLLPEAYLYGFVDVLSISNPGQSSFLFGHLYPHGVPQYFPSVVLIKSTVGMLLLATLTLIALLRHSIRMDRRDLYLLTLSGVWMVGGMVSTLNIGYRHILPFIAPLCCLLGAAAIRLWRTGHRPMRLALALLLYAHAGESLTSFPNEMAFGNVAFGGVGNSHNLLTDSNNDWSQSLPQLATWLRQNRVQNCWFAYDGMARPSHSGIPCRSLVPNLFGVSGEPPSPLQNGTFILSGLSQSGIEWERPDLNPYDVFRRIRPVAVIGGADMIYEGTYDLTREIAVHRTVQAMNLNAAKHFAEAMTLARMAVTSLPTSALAHLQLANSLQGLGRTEEAHRQYVNALAIAVPQPQWYFLSLPEMEAGKRSTRSRP